MGELFGTDGIRGIAGHHPLDADTIFRTGFCLAGHLAAHVLHLHILQRRFPAIPVLIYPVAVQGEAAPREIEQAAEILGASRWRTLFEIVLPLIRSGLVATFLFILILIVKPTGLFGGKE